MARELYAVPHERYAFECMLRQQGVDVPHRLNIIFETAILASATAAGEDLSARIGGLSAPQGRQENLNIFDNDNPVHELLTNDRAEARVDAYLGANMRGDEYTALALWQLDEKVTRAGVPDRRMAVTGVLISARPTAYRVLKTEWWTTCCDPHLVDGPRNAGLARIQVAIDGADTYVFDVLTHDTVYWGDAAGNPPHNWTLRDVYRSGDRPLFFLRALSQGGMLAYHEANDHKAARSARRAPPT